jgi:hypothetical protein
MFTRKHLLFSSKICTDCFHSPPFLWHECVTTTTVLIRVSYVKLLHLQVTYPVLN